MTTTPKRNNSLVPRILVDAALCGSFISWQLYGSEGAHNLFLFMAWGLAILCILAATVVLLAGVKAPNTPKDPWLYRMFARCRGAGLIAASAWLGMPGLATAWCMAWFMGFLWHKQGKAEGGAA